MMGIHQKQARVFKAFDDESRLMILEMLRDGEKCASEMLDHLHISQPTLSHHMRILCDSGVVRSRKAGKWVFYNIDTEGREEAYQLLKQLTTLEEEVSPVQAVV